MSTFLPIRTDEPSTDELFRTIRDRPTSFEDPEFAESDGKALQHVRQRYQVMFNYKRRYAQRNNFFYQLYRGYQRPRQYPFHDIPRSNVFVPYPFATVEQIAPRIIDAVLGQDDYFDVVGREETDHKNALKHKLILKRQLELMEFVLEAAMTIKSAVMYGYSAAKIYWERSVRPRHTLRVKTSFAGTYVSDAIRKKYGAGLYEEIVEEDAVDYDDNRFRHIAFDDFYVDPSAVYTLRTGRDCLHVSRTTLRELGRLRNALDEPIYKNLEQIPAKPRYSQEDSDKDRRLSVIGASKETWREVSTTELDKGMQEVVLWEYWTRDWVVTIANEQTVIRRERNPFWHAQMPFVDLNYTYIPNELFGIGAIESQADLAQAENTITNMDLDNWAMAVNQMYVVWKQANIPREQLVSRPWGVIYSDAPVQQAIMPLTRQSIAGETANQHRMMRANLMLATGLSDIHYLGAGATSRAGTTATGLVRAVEEGNIRFNLGVKFAEFMLMTPAFKMFGSNNNQFMRTLRSVRTTGMTDFERILPEEIWGDFDYRFMGASKLLRDQANQHNLLNFLRSVGNSPPFMAQLKPRRIMLEALRRYNFERPEEFLVEAPDTIRTPEEEHELLFYEQRVEPSWEENLEEHLQKHLTFKGGPIYMAMSDRAKELFEEHLAKTVRFAQMVMSAKMGAAPAGEGQFGPAQQMGALNREAAGVGANAEQAGGYNEYLSGQV